MVCVRCGLKKEGAPLMKPSDELLHKMEPLPYGNVLKSMSIASQELVDGYLMDNSAYSDADRILDILLLSDPKVTRSIRAPGRLTLQIRLADQRYIPWVSLQLDSTWSVTSADAEEARHLSSRNVSVHSDGVCAFEFTEVDMNANLMVNWEMVKSIASKLGFFSDINALIFLACVGRDVGEIRPRQQLLHVLIDCDDQLHPHEAPIQHIQLVNDDLSAD